MNVARLTWRFDEIKGSSVIGLVVPDSEDGYLLALLWRVVLIKKYTLFSFL